MKSLLACLDKLVLCGFTCILKEFYEHDESTILTAMDQNPLVTSKITGKWRLIPHEYGIGISIYRVYTHPHLPSCSPASMILRYNDASEVRSPWWPSAVRFVSRSEDGILQWSPSYAGERMGEKEYHSSWFVFLNFQTTYNIDVTLSYPQKRCLKQIQFSLNSASFWALL